MSKAKRILFVTDERDFTDKLFLSGMRKRIKGFIKLGHDTHVFNYRRAFLQSGPVMSRKFARRRCKERVVGAPIVSAEVEALAELMSISIVDAQRSLAAYSKEQRKVILSNEKVVAAGKLLREKRAKAGAAALLDEFIS